MHHLLIFHGRRCCSARTPECERCVIKEYCKQYQEE
ncbi:MAG: endonuclease III, partial [Firmicutes bacterium]|nr:endonuclease III [Bacillota bacterium]